MATLLSAQLLQLASTLLMPSYRDYKQRKEMTPFRSAEVQDIETIGGRGS